MFLPAGVLHYFSMKYIVPVFLILSLAGCYRSDAYLDPLVAIQIQDRNGLTETINAPDRLAVYNETDFLSSQPYKKILRVYKKSGKSHSIITTYHSNGNVWQYLEVQELRAHGPYREWHSNGQLKIEAKVIGGTADVAPGTQRDWLFDELSQVWNEQGHLIATIPYRHGVLEGKSLYYYPSGQIEKELPFTQNVLNGEAVEHFDNGKLKSKVFYIQGTKEGISLGFFENGQVRAIEEFTEGLLLKGAYYDVHGEKLAEVEDGMGFQAVFEGDFLTYLVQIFQGAAEGGVKLYASNGELLGLYHIKNGTKHGEEISYFLAAEKEAKGVDSLPKLSVQWDRDTIHGKVKTWYNNGQLQSQRDYSRNKKNGSSLSWYRDGTLMLLEEYEEGHLVKGQYYKKNGRDPVSTIFNGSGTASLYDENGIFLKKVVYAKGDPVDPEN